MFLSTSSPLQQCGATPASVTIHIAWVIASVVISTVIIGVSRRRAALSWRRGLELNVFVLAIALLPLLLLSIKPCALGLAFYVPSDLTLPWLALGPLLVLGSLWAQQHELRKALLQRMVLSYLLVVLCMSGVVLIRDWQMEQFPNFARPLPMADFYLALLLVALVWLWPCLERWINRVWLRDDTLTDRGAAPFTSQAPAVDQALAHLHQRLGHEREQIRREIAHYLHDGPIQEIIGLSYQIAHLRRRLKSAPAQDSALSAEFVSTLHAVQQGLLDVVAQLRSLITTLRPPVLSEFGLAAALEAYVISLQRDRCNSLPAISLELDRRGTILPERLALCLFRVAQEALRNALRHAQAQSIRVGLHLSADHVVLYVCDDGCGFHVPSRLSTLAHGHHFGLLGLSEQVLDGGGTFTIDSKPGKGTRIWVSLPLDTIEDKIYAQSKYPCVSG